MLQCVYLNLHSHLYATAAPFRVQNQAAHVSLAGVSKVADDLGYLTYQRPEGKSGGHGVGWSEIPRYSFKLPPGWEETPVSIADLGGTEVRFPTAEESSEQL